MSILLKVIYKCKSLSKLQRHFSQKQKKCAKSMWTYKTQNSQNNLEQKEQSWKHHITWLQNTLQNYSNQNSMELSFKKKKKHLDQWNRTGSWEIKLCVYSQLVQQWYQEHTMQNRAVSSKNGVGKLDIHMQRNGNESVSHTIYKNQFKID